MATYRAATVAVFRKENEHSNIRPNVVKELLENVQYYAQIFAEGLSRQTVMMDTRHSLLLQYCHRY